MSEPGYVFDLERCIEELYQEAYPLNNEESHPSGRCYRPGLQPSIAAFVPGGKRSRFLQRNRDYVKLDFLDFLDYSTSELSLPPSIDQFPDQTAVFYESIVPTSVMSPDAVWGDAWKFSIRDVAIARDGMFVTVIMRFHIWLKDAVEEYLVTLTLTPESRTPDSDQNVQLAEWQRVGLLPPSRVCKEWRYELTKELFSNPDRDDLTLEEHEIIAKNAKAYMDQDDELLRATAPFFEMARLGFHLPSYVEFMYDLVSEEKLEVKTHRKKPQQSRRRGKQIDFDRPVYKLIRSIRIVRPENMEPGSTYRHWTAPSFSFAVKGHWRNFADKSKVGHDMYGKEILGRTWVSSYRKYEEKPDEKDSTFAKHDPRVVIGIKQTLQFARDVIQSQSVSQEPHTNTSPTKEWVAQERAKLTAALRYFILKRDGFRCSKCGRSAVEDNYVRLEVDHVIPVSRGGKTVEENLKTLCRDCNRGKSDDCLHVHPSS